jgi:hypothetical protein
VTRRFSLQRARRVGSDHGDNPEFADVALWRWIDWSKIWPEQNDSSQDNVNWEPDSPANPRRTDAKWNGCESAKSKFIDLVAGQGRNRTTDTRIFRDLSGWFYS